jgi:hypothetical protein
MTEKTYSELTKAERDRRWADSHQAGRDEKQAQLQKQGLGEREAYREADRQQTEITNRARDGYKRADGKD